MRFHKKQVCQVELSLRAEDIIAVFEDIDDDSWASHGPHSQVRKHQGSRDDGIQVKKTTRPVRDI